MPGHFGDGGPPPLTPTRVLSAWTANPPVLLVVVLLVFSGFVYYLGVGRSWGPDLRVDQDIGAGILWIGGDIIGLPFLATVAVRMSKETRALPFR